MFSKLTTGLVLTMSLLLASNAFAQTTQTKKTAKTKAVPTKKTTTDTSKQDEAAKIAAQKKAEEEKAEAKRIEEAKAAAAKAEESSSNSGVLGYLKSHFTVSYHGEYYGTRRDIESQNEEDHEIQDLRIMHNPTLIFRPMKNWKFLATSEFKYTDAPGPYQGSFINRHYRSLITLTRENVFTEKEIGVKVDLGIGRRVTDRNHGKAKVYGNSRVFVNFSKKFSDTFSAGTLVQYISNDPAKGKIDSGTWKHDANLIPTFTWNITDKLSWLFNDDFNIYTSWYGDNYNNLFLFHEMNIAFLSYQFTDQHSVYFQYKYMREPATPTSWFQKGQREVDHFDYYIGYTYALTPKISFTPEIGSTMFTSRDNRFFAKTFKYPEVAFYLDITL